MLINQDFQPLNGLAKKLVIEKLLTEQQACQATQEAKNKHVSLVSHLVKSSLLSSQQIAMTASQSFGEPLLDLDAFDSNLIPRGLISDRLIKRHHALPLFKRGTRLYVAVSDPTDITALDEFKFHSGLNTEAILVEEEKLTKAIDTFLEDGDQAIAGFADSEFETLELDVIDTSEKADATKNEDIDDAPLVRFVNKILLDAIKLRASDIHIEPYEKYCRIRFRTDGILHEAIKPPLSLANRIASRIKVMSRMDISERRIPQDGHIKLRVSQAKTIDFRVNTLPTVFGEKVVLRILDSSASKVDIDELGFEPDQKALYLKALYKPQGMILVTGPTGSGKTVSLYTGLSLLNRDDRNISTIEDPVEINLSGVNQVNVHNKVGLNFSAALRAFLRQDPDVIMVGEIRDLETAEIAIKASQTGHMVLSTLHTNSAAETMMRLRSMGVPTYNLASSVELIIAQRLVRRLCDFCKEFLKLPKESLLEAGFDHHDLKNIQIFKAVGCERCHQGYHGRIGIYEVVPMTPSIAELILSDGNSMQLAEQARQEGYFDLRQSGLKKVQQGVTTLDEINRVTVD